MSPRGAFPSCDVDDGIEGGAMLSGVSCSVSLTKAPGITRLWE